MIRHVVLIRFKDDVTPADIDRLEAGLQTLPGKIPAIVTYSFGRDLEISEGTSDFAIVADFADAEAYHAYATDPKHVKVLKELSQPLAADIKRVQFEIS